MSKVKKAAAVLVLAAASLFKQADAGTIATLVNTSGGLIALTDVKCEGRKTLVAYTTNSRGNTLFGCWFADENFVFIQWSDGDVRTYPLGVWNMNQKRDTY